MYAYVKKMCLCLFDNKTICKSIKIYPSGPIHVFSRLRPLQIDTFTYIFIVLRLDLGSVCFSSWYLHTSYLYSNFAYLPREREKVMNANCENGTP